MSTHKTSSSNINKAKQYLYLMRLNRPVGIFLLLWPTLWALWISSEGHPDTKILIVFILGVIVMRSAGCVINDYLDRDIDPYVRRTLDRPLASGKLRPKDALILFGVLMTIAFLLASFLDMKTLAMAVGGAILAVIYPLMKRIIYLPQGFLGLAFGWSIPMAFVAQTGTVPKEAWLLYAATIFWVIAYDSIYAIPDKEDDMRIGVKSSVILFDDLDSAVIMGLQITFFVSMLLLARQLSLGLYFLSSLAFAFILVIYQHLLLKKKTDDHCIKAFKNNNWIGALIFTGLFLNYFLA